MIDPDRPKATALREIKWMPWKIEAYAKSAYSRLARVNPIAASASVDSEDHIFVSRTETFRVVYTDLAAPAHFGVGGITAAQLKGKAYGAFQLQCGVQETDEVRQMLVEFKELLRREDKLILRVRCERIEINGEHRYDKFHGVLNVRKHRL